MQLIFPRYPERSDLTVFVIGADSLSGPWTDLAVSTAGGNFVAVTTGATVVETGTGAVREVTVTDPYPVTDPAHPRRYLRLKIRR